MKVNIRKQKRNTLAFKLTPHGAEVLIPSSLETDSPKVEQFIADAIERLPECDNGDDPLTRGQIEELVSLWQEELQVGVSRLQIRTMKNKWGSVSTAGTLTLAEELSNLPYDLAEYVVVHELLHLKFPDHRKGWQVSMGMYLPDWKTREQRLQAYIVRENA